MDDSALSVEQLSALSRAVPDDSERTQLELYLAGSHPRHPGVNSVERLGTVERYFVEVRGIPRLGERIQAFVFSRTFPGTRAKVGWGGRWMALGGGGRRGLVTHPLGGALTLTFGRIKGARK